MCPDVQTTSAPIPRAPSSAAARRVAWAVLAAVQLAAVPLRAQVGSPDPTFDGDGVVITDLAAIDRSWAVGARGDGTLLVVGETQATNIPSREALLIEYGSDGSVLQSRTYNVQPGCDVPETLYAIAEETDGHLIVGGYAYYGCSSDSQVDFWLQRLNADGSSPTIFERPAFYNSYDHARDLAIQPDGSIVAAGVAGVTPASADWNFGIARWKPDGTLDSTGFGTAGWVGLDFAGGLDFGVAVDFDASGRIVVAGLATQSAQFDFAIARLLPDGSLDPAFGTGGKVTTDLAGFDDQASDVVALPDGRILVAGTSVSGDGVTSDPVVIRYLPDGTLDPTFGSAGIAVVDFGFRPAWGARILMQHDGRLVVAGTAQTGADESTKDLAIARLLPDGGPDPTFDGDGARTVDIGFGREDVGLGLTLQPADGNLVVAGYSVEDTGGDPHYDVAIARFVGDAPSLIFADGFESGGTSAWTSATP